MFGQDLGFPALPEITTGEIQNWYQGTTPRDFTHDPEPGYPVIVTPVVTPEVSALFNEALRAYFRDQKAAKTEVK